MAEDGEWHEAVVERVSSEQSTSTTTPPRAEATVRFVEFNKVQAVSAANIQSRESAALTSDDETDMVGACELCRRSSIPLTRHHLIPRRTHAKYKKKGVPSKELEASAYICRLGPSLPLFSSTVFSLKYIISSDAKVI
jgi:hypothetical protein